MVEKEHTEAQVSGWERGELTAKVSHSEAVSMHHPGHASGTLPPPEAFWALLRPCIVSSSINEEAEGAEMITPRLQVGNTSP